MKEEGGEEAGAMKGERDDEEDLGIAEENMEVAWEILADALPEDDDGIEGGGKTDTDAVSATSSTTENGDGKESPAKKSRPNPAYTSYTLDLIPRVISGYADLLSSLGRNGEAVAALLECVEWRDKNVAEASDAKGAARAERLLVDTLVALCEALFECDCWDRALSIDGNVVVKEGEMMDYIDGYYQRAREELQKCIYKLGEWIRDAGEGEKEDVTEEKEMTCQISVIMMGFDGRLRGKKGELEEGEGGEGGGGKKEEM